MYFFIMKTEFLNAFSLIILGAISSMLLVDVLTVLGTIMVLINQYYRMNRTVNKYHNGSWKSYFKSLKNKKNAK